MCLGTLSLSRAHTQGFYSCDHFPLFELGSCHHKQYVINLQFRLLPLSTIPQYSGLAPIQKIHIYVCHRLNCG